MPLQEGLYLGYEEVCSEKKGRGLRSRAEEGKRFEIAGPIRKTALWA